VAVSFGENRTTRRKPPSYRKLLVISRIKYLINQSMLSSLHKKVDFIYYGNNCHSILKKKTEKLHSEHQRLILIKFREKCDMNNKMHCKHVLLHESHTYFYKKPTIFCFIQGSVYTVFCFIQGSVYTVFCFIQSSVTTIFCFIQSSVTTVFCFIQSSVTTVFCFIQSSV
jgi:hypothetical protein